METYNERRKHTRYPRSYRVVYSSLDQPTEEIETESFNISIGGIGIFAKSPIDQGRKLKIKIFSSQYNADPVEAEGVLRWHEEAGSNDPGYRAGVKFESVPWTRLGELIPA